MAATQLALVRSDLGGKLKKKMPISCVAFGCTNKQKSQEKKGEGASSSEKSPENNETSSLKQNVAFHRYVFSISCQQIPSQLRPKTVFTPHWVTQRIFWS